MTALLVDASNVIVRSLRAMERTGLSADGVPTGALHNFVLTVARHICEEQPTHVAVCWDGGRSVKRVALDPGYKAHRLTQPEFEEVKDDTFALAREFCTLAGIFHVGRAGYEADDLIAHYWRQHRPLDDKLVILSNDKDFLQLLIDDNVEQVRLSSANTPTDRWTAERVRADMGCDPRQLAAVMALMGDASDGVPGVRGMGPKTAVKRLAQWRWNLHEALTLDERLSPHKERVLTNLRLVDLRQLDSALHLPPLPEFRPTAPGSALYGELLSYLSRYRMVTIKDRLIAGTLWSR